MPGHPEKKSGTEVYLEPCETSKIEHLAKIVRLSAVSYFCQKNSVLDIWRGSKFTFEEHLVLSVVAEITVSNVLMPKYYPEYISTVKNTVISPNFLVWKFCGKAQFPHSFGRIARDYAQIVPFHKILHQEIR